jgi:hypothetical protein
MLDFGAAFRIQRASRHADTGEAGYEESGEEG